MHLESLLDKIGGFGVYQMRLITVLSGFKAICVPTMLMMAFASVEPNWWCESHDNISDAIFRNGSYRNCDWNTTCDRRFDDVMVTAVSEWDLVCQKKWIGNTITSIQMVGVLVGAICSGYGSDTYGRKKIMYSGILIGSIGNLVAAFSVSWIMFTVLRFILGFAVGLFLSVIYLYQVEFVGTKWRGVVASLPSWSVGVVLFAVLAWVIQNWKWMHITIAVTYFIFLLSWRFVPESLRWLTVKGHLEEARHVVNQMAAINKKPVPDTSILELIAEEERAEGDKAKKYTYLDLFKTRNLTRRTLFSCFVWFSLSVVYYGISFGVKNLSGDIYMNLMIMAVIELPSCLVVLCMVYIVQRRTATAMFLVLSTVSSFGVAIATRTAPKDIGGRIENGLAITAKFFAISAWAVAQAMTSEQFPTVIRNLAYASQSTSARVGAILAAQLLSLGAKNDLMPPFIAMGILMCLTALICFTLEETRRKALEDTMENGVMVIKEEVNQTLMDNKESETAQTTQTVMSNDIEITTPIAQTTQTLTLNNIEITTLNTEKGVGNVENTTTDSDEKT